MNSVRQKRLHSSPVMNQKPKNFKSDQSVSKQERVSPVSKSNSEEPMPNGRPMNKPVSSTYIITGRDLAAFFKLLDNDHLIYDFLNYDACCKLADKYLLAMAFVYFKRAGLRSYEYNRLNFFIALYLAHDMEEDEEELKYEILYWALGKNWPLRVRRFLNKRNNLWKRMNYRAIVSCQMCHDLISLAPDHYAWHRHRLAHHAGAVRCYDKANQQPPTLLRDRFASPPVCRLCFPWDSTDDSSQEQLDLVDSSQIPCHSPGKCYGYKIMDAFELFGRLREE